MRIVLAIVGGIVLGVIGVVAWFTYQFSKAF